MARFSRSASRRPIDIWPGFVDALATLLILIIFLLMIFVLAQFFLGQALSGRNKDLDRLGLQLTELTDLLELERKTNAGLMADVARLSADLTGSSAEVEALQALKEELEARVAQLDATLSDKEAQVANEREASKQARAQAALLNKQLEALRQEISRLAEALDASEKANKEQKVQISALGKRLNQALASRVQELARYRSEFFGRLRDVLGKREGIRIEGDRFVFQSEVLFATGSAELGKEGQRRIDQLAKTLLEIAKDIPADIGWILRVDGHTDAKPIKTARFPSNWELSTARAVSVVKRLIAKGIPAERLAATGFGEHQPIDPADTPEALARNRRIELRFDRN